MILTWAVNQCAHQANLKFTRGQVKHEIDPRELCMMLLSTNCQVRVATCCASKNHSCNIGRPGPRPQVRQIDASARLINAGPFVENEGQAAKASYISRRRLIKGTAVSFCGCAGSSSVAFASQNQLSGGGVWPGRWGWYDRYFALAMTSMEDYEREVEPLKRRLHKTVLEPGCTVLELGMGTGPNLRYQAACPGVHVTGIDVNTAMAQYAQQAAESAGLPQNQLRLVTGDIQKMPFEDDSFDVVVSTLVLCSVADVSSVLSEAARVLRPGGRFLFIEHVLAPPSNRLLQWQQQLLDPLQQLAADRCHLTRDTGATIAACGRFATVDAEQPFYVPGAGLIAPTAAGVAYL